MALKSSRTVQRSYRMWQKIGRATKNALSHHEKVGLWITNDISILLGLSTNSVAGSAGSLSEEGRRQTTSQREQVRNDQQQENIDQQK